MRSWLLLDDALRYASRCQSQRSGARFTKFSSRSPGSEVVITVWASCSNGPPKAPPNIPAPAAPLSEIDVERWQYDLWFQISRAVLDGHPEQVDLTYHPALQLPAMSRYAVTTPALERWFKKYNANRPYEDRVKPSNFMCGFQASPLAATGEETFVIGDGSKSPRKTKQHPLRPIAPYSRTSKEASTHVCDRETGKSIPTDQLKNYAQALAQYHLRPEAKFENGDYFDSGPTGRRHVQTN
jgi:hypothetical protein